MARVDADAPGVMTEVTASLPLAVEGGSTEAEAWAAVAALLASTEG